MSNGPDARIAEIVVNTLPRDRSRNTIHKDPQYYAIRNHLVDFLVSRSKEFTERPPRIMTRAIRPR
jgi:nitrate/nitrite transport system ATP-binding protein